MENFDQNKKDRQIDNLINLVENHTRTERHLEQYSNIGNKDNKKHAREIQDVREEQIENLKNKLCTLLQKWGYGLTNGITMRMEVLLKTLRSHEKE